MTGQAIDTGLLDTWVKSVIASLSSANRKKLFQRMGMDMRTANKNRMTAQQGPDGQAWEPRKLRTGKIKRRVKSKKMMQGLRKIKSMKLKAWADGLSLGFEGKVSRIARIHHLGLKQKFKYKTTQYPERPLLGISKEDKKNLRNLFMEQLSLERR